MSTGIVLEIGDDPVPVHMPFRVVPGVQAIRRLRVQLGVTSVKLSQRLRHDCPTRSPSSTTCSIPNRSSSWLTANPACPAPMTTVVTLDLRPLGCFRTLDDHRSPVSAQWANRAAGG